MRSVHLRVVLAVVVTASAAIVGCGSDDDATGSPDVPASVTAADSPDGQLDAISGEEICERLTVASVAADTGLDVVRATPDDEATPQCAYEYTTDTGGVSNLTVASMRNEDVNGLAGSDAFDFFLQINESVAC